MILQTIQQCLLHADREKKNITKNLENMSAVI